MKKEIVVDKNNSIYKPNLKERIAMSSSMFLEESNLSDFNSEESELLEIAD